MIYHHIVQLHKSLEKPFRSQMKDRNWAADNLVSSLDSEYREFDKWEHCWKIKKKVSELKHQMIKESYL